MPFIDAPRAPGPRSEIRASIFWHGSNRQYLVYIRIGRALCDLRRWTAGTPVRLLWGIGDDFGKACLRADQNAGRKLRRNTSTFLDFQTGHLPQSELRDAKGGVWRLVEARHRPVACSHMDEPGGGIAIDLPGGWFERVGETRRNKARWVA